MEGKKLFLVFIFFLLVDQGFSEVEIEFAKGLKKVSGDVTLEREMGNFSFKIVPELCLGEEGVINPKWKLSLDERSKLKNRLGLAELKVRYSKYNLGFTLGKSKMVWDESEFRIKPLEIGPNDYTDLLDFEKIGVINAQVNYLIGSRHSLQLVVNQFTPARLPLHPKNYWYLMSIPVIDRKLPLKAIEFGGNFSTILYGATFTGVIQYGYNPYPYFIPEVRYFRRSMVGLGVQRTLPLDFLARVEIGCLFPASQSQDDKYLQGTISIGRLFSNILEDSDLKVGLQYAKEFVLKEGPHPSRNNLGRVYKEHIGGEIELISSYVTVNCQTLFSLKEHLIRLSLKREWVGEITSEVFVDILGGKSTSFFGQYAKKDRVGFRVIWR